LLAGLRFCHLSVVVTISLSLSCCCHTAPPPPPPPSRPPPLPLPPPQVGFHVYRGALAAKAEQLRLEEEENARRAARRVKVKEGKSKGRRVYSEEERGKMLQFVQVRTRAPPGGVDVKLKCVTNCSIITPSISTPSIITINPLH